MLLSDVCLSRTSGLTREQRPGKTKIGTVVAHVTRDSDTSFKVKRSKVNLLLMSLIANMPEEINTKILSTCRGQRHIVSPRAQLVGINFNLFNND